MNLNLTREWLDTKGAESVVLTDASPALDASSYLALQLGTGIGDCRWEGLEAWEKEARQRPSAFSSMAVAIIKTARDAAAKVAQNGRISIPGEWTVLRERMNAVIDADIQSPEFSDAVTALAGELQPALLNTMMTAPQSYGRVGLQSSLLTMSGTVAGGIAAIAPKSSKADLEGLEETQNMRTIPLENRDPRAVVFSLLSDVAYTISVMIGEVAAYRDRNELIGEPLPYFETWPERVLKNPLPVSLPQ